MKTWFCRAYCSFNVIKITNRLTLQHTGLGHGGLNGLGSDLIERFFAFVSFPSTSQHIILPRSSSESLIFTVNNNMTNTNFK